MWVKTVDFSRKVSVVEVAKKNIHPSKSIPLLESNQFEKDVLKPIE